MTWLTCTTIECSQFAGSSRKRPESTRPAVPTVAPCTPTLLAVADHALANCLMNNEANVKLVDTHSESFGCDDDLQSLMGGDGRRQQKRKQTASTQWRLKYLRGSC